MINILSRKRGLGRRPPARRPRPGNHISGDPGEIGPAHLVSAEYQRYESRPRIHDAQSESARQIVGETRRAELRD